jgi:hypothetical protein
MHVLSLPIMSHIKVLSMAHLNICCIPAYLMLLTCLVVEFSLVLVCVSMCVCLCARRCARVCMYGSFRCVCLLHHTYPARRWNTNLTTEQYQPKV